MAALKLASKNPTIKRILREAAELANQPSSDYHAAPMESDLFEWHFTIRGPPAPSPFDGGIYHGRINLPPAYPLKPPSFRFLTATGRFEVNREICLSISGHHEETWQPAWGIRTALVAIRSFMDTSAGGQIGGMEANEEARKRMAGQSPNYKCPTCAKTNGEIMKEQEALLSESDAKAVEDVVPEELRLAYREELGKDAAKAEAGSSTGQSEKSLAAQTISAETSSSSQATVTAPQSSHAQVPTQTLAQPVRPPIHDPGIPAWIDKAIYGVIAALVFMLWKKLLS